MSEMVERAARAIYDVASVEGVTIPWRDTTKGSRELHREFARAAIEAMLQPTEAMIDHAHSVTMPDSDNMQCPNFYKAMISAALQD